VDNAEPTEAELGLSTRLEEWFKENAEFEDKAERTLKEKALKEIGVTVRSWVKKTCKEKGIPHDLAAEAGANLYTSGSYRMGLREKGTDIDIICVCPIHVTREDFFATLLPIIEQNPKMTKINPIPNAKVPMIGF